MKRVPGHKTDLSDADWLAEVAAHGMVRPSFVPPPLVREWRQLTRYRRSQIDARAMEIQRLEELYGVPAPIARLTAEVVERQKRW